MLLDSIFFRFVSFVAIVQAPLATLRALRAKSLKALVLNTFLITVVSAFSSVASAESFQLKGIYQDGANIDASNRIFSPSSVVEVPAGLKADIKGSVARVRMVAPQAPCQFKFGETVSIDISRG